MVINAMNDDRSQAIVNLIEVNNITSYLLYYILSVSSLLLDCYLKLIILF